MPTSSFASETLRASWEPGCTIPPNWGSMMSKKRSRVLGSWSSEMIRKAWKNMEQMTQEQRIDVAVRAGVMTPEQAERAKKKWAELQAADCGTPEARE